MGKKKIYDGYKAYNYLEAGFDYKEFNLTKATDRVPPYIVPLSKNEEDRYEEFIEKNIIIDLHEHPVLWADDMAEAFELNHMGRDFTAYEALSKARIDCVFDHLMDGTAYITSYSGWKWSDVIHDIGIRLCDLHHQSMVTHCKTIRDIEHAAENGKVAMVLALESATPIENELDRIDILHGIGVRSLGICYSESNMLGGGMGETNQDSGLTDFGYDAVKRMNKVGMLIDVGHTNDRTAIMTIEASDKPVYNSHSGPSAIAQGHTNGDEALHAFAENHGLLAIGGAGRGLRTKENPVGSIESYMECVEYCIDLMGINNVACGPDTLYGDHQGLYVHWFARPLGNQARPGRPQEEAYPIPPGVTDPGYVRGLENPNDFVNIARWMIKHGYTDEETAKIMGQNAIRLLRAVW
jgi:membrane dipeptidase